MPKNIKKIEEIKFERIEEVEELKKCYKCGKEFPKTLDYFRKRSRAKDGFDYACKECRGVKFLNQSKKGYKLCNECGKELPATTEYFYKCSSNSEGLYGDCIDCQKEKAAKYRVENRDKIREYSRNFMKNNPEKRIQYYERYKAYCGGEEKFNELNKAKYHKDVEASRKYNRLKYQRNKEKARERQKKYATSEQGRNIKRIIYQRRRNRELSLYNNFEPKNWEDCKDYFRNKNGNTTCAYCGKETDKVTMEHFIPVSKGGELSHNNILPVCKSCNSSKCNKDFFEWYPQQGFYSKKREKKILEYLNYTKDGSQQLTIAI